MKTNEFHRFMLSLVGCNQNSKLSKLDKVKHWIIIAMIFSYYFYFAFVSTITFLIVNWNNTTEILTALFQLSGVISGLLAYINLICYQNLVNETFRYIEMIVNQRKKLVNEDLYSKMIRIAEKYVKYPFLICVVSTALNALVPIIFNVIMDILRGEIHTENWFLPFRFT